LFLAEAALDRVSLSREKIAFVGESSEWKPND
jgi:hypothetical protein